MTSLHRLLLLFALACGPLRAAGPDSSPLVVSVAERFGIFPARSNATGQPIDAGIEIYADGTTIFKSRDGREGAKHIDAGKVRELLTYFADQHLFELTAEKITADTGKAGPLPAPTDQPNTVLFATSDGRKVTIVQHAFSYFAAKFPAVDSVQIMNRCIARIYEVAGEKRADDWVGGTKGQP